MDIGLIELYVRPDVLSKNARFRLSLPLKRDI